MLANVGKADRGLRLIAGIVLILLPFVTNFGANSALLTWGSVVVGGILALTSILKFCPAYRIFGMNTCSKETHGN